MDNLFIVYNLYYLNSQNRRETYQRTEYVNFPIYTPVSIRRAFGKIDVGDRTYDDDGGLVTNN